MKQYPPITSHKGFSRTIARRHIVGGLNNVDLDGCIGWRLRRCRLSNPRGTAESIGSDWHNAKAWNCTDLELDMVTAESEWKRGDPFSVGNCVGVVLSRLKVKGPLFEDGDGDIAADICIDGTGDGGCDIEIRDTRVRRIVIAAGRDIRLVNVRAGIVEISGAYYDGNPERPIVGVQLQGCRIGELYVHRETVSGLTEVDSTIKRRTY